MKAIAAVALIASSFAGHVKHYSSLKVSRPVCQWIAQPKPPNYQIIALKEPDAPQLALCKVIVTERFQMIDPNTGRVDGIGSADSYSELVSVQSGRAAVYYGGPIG